MSPSAERRPHAADRPSARWLAVLFVTAAMTVSLGWLARAPWQSHGSDEAMLRLSWRLRPPASETCRTRTQAELDALPVHMRTPEVCESVSGAYRLVVQVDTLVADTTRVRRGGAKGDRPLYVLREFPVAPGAHRVHVRFDPEESMPSQPDVPPLALDTVLHMQGRAIVLLTLDTDGRTIVVRRSTQD